MQHIITDEEVEQFWEHFYALPSGTDRAHKEATKDTLNDFLNNRPESTLGKLRPIAEMPETVPEGCVRKYAFLDGKGEWCVHNTLTPYDTHCFDIQLPTPDPEAEERHRFEKWMVKHNPVTAYSLKLQDGLYALREHETAWQAWKASKLAKQPNETRI